jgi:hypothetical protein
MSILIDSKEVVKPFVTIKRHVSGAWQPFYTDSRSTQVLRIYTRFNNRPTVEYATRKYADDHGLEYREPVL